MKTKILRFIVPCLASLVCLTGCGDDVEPPTKDGYYKGIDFTLEGTELVYALQEHTFEKHKVYIPYSQYNSYCSNSSNRYSIERVSEDNAKNQFFYTGKETTGYGTREHVWPCAKSAQLWVHDGQGNKGVHNVDYNAYAGGGSDLFHVRTCNSNVNTARGDSRYVEFDDISPDLKADKMSYGETGGKYEIQISGYSKGTSKNPQYANLCEVADEMKGDVARILVYVWMHYTQRSSVPDGSVTVQYSKTGKYELEYKDMVGKLSFNNVLAYETISECATKLIRWNEIDPPSETEKLRNTTVQKIQGNRNPFVDFPELVKQCLNEYIVEE